MNYDQNSKKIHQWLLYANITEFKHKLLMNIMNLVHRDSGDSGSCSDRFRPGYSSMWNWDAFSI